MRTMTYCPWVQEYVDFLPDEDWNKIVEAETELDELLDTFLQTHEMTTDFEIDGERCYRGRLFFAAIDSNPMPGHCKETIGADGRHIYYVRRRDMPQLALYHWSAFQGHKTNEQYEAEQWLIIAKGKYNKMLDDIARRNPLTEADADGI